MECDGLLERDYASENNGQQPDTWAKGGVTLEHVEENPVHFSSKRQLKAYCQQKGLSSGALL